MLIEEQMTIYHMILWFFAFSFFGYLLDCVVLSYENKTLVYNRGFGHGPFCIIYGFGALGACLFLQRFASHTVILYFASMMMATSMELVTATLMIKLFGAFWWDYSKKRFNYRGIICLQSSVAWGFLGIFFFRFLNGFVHHMVEYVPTGYERRLAISLIVFYIADFTYTMRMQLREAGEVEEAEDGEESSTVVGRLKVY